MCFLLQICKCFLYELCFISVSREKCPALSVSRLVQTSPSSCVSSMMKINAKCSFSCPQGYQLQGPSQKQCGSGGQWTDSAKTVSCIGELHWFWPSLVLINVTSIFNIFTSPAVDCPFIISILKTCSWYSYLNDKPIILTLYYRRNRRLSVKVKTFKAETGPVVPRPHPPPPTGIAMACNVSVFITSFGHELRACFFQT